MIKNSSPLFQWRLMDIFNEIHKTWIYPHQWKIVHITSIPKTRHLITPIEKIRPISLISNYLKEQWTLAERLKYILEDTLPDSIFGFRPLRVVQTLHHHLQHNLAMGIGKKLHSVVLSLDLKKAYDNMEKDCIINQLRKLNISEYFIQIIDSYLSNRHINVKINNSLSQMFNVTKSIPQGSPLSCQLFNLYILSLANEIQKI